MKKFITILATTAIISSIPANVFALKENAELRAFLQNTGNKYQTEIVEIDKYFADIDYPLKKQLYDNQIIRESVINALPQTSTLTREDFFRLYMEFEVGDKRLAEVTEDPFLDIPKDDDFAQIAAYLKTNEIFKGKLGNFEPDKEMTRSEMKTIFPGVEDIYISDQDEPLKLTDAINYFYRLYNPKFPSKVSYTSPTKITLDDQYFYNNGQKIEGIMAHWHVAEELYSDKDIRRELQAMKSMGIIGIATEVPWRTVEQKPGTYTFPTRIESLLTIAQEENMWVTLAISPHYIPEWMDEKYGDDYKLKDKDLNVIKSSGFMNYSLHGPAVPHIIDFQKEAIKHYEKYDNLLAVFLSNEPGYAEDFAGDYSNYARSAYMKWCEDNGFDHCLVPEDPQDNAYHRWQQFNRQSLTNYLNKTYNSAKDELEHMEKFIPISHKIVPYFLTNPHAANIALNTTPGNIEWDFIAADIYGYTPHLYDLLKGYKKPILIAETNFIDGFDRHSFYEFLLNQYLHGASIQTVYKWENSMDKYSLFAPSGKFNENAHALVKAAAAISQIGENFTHKQPSISLVIPQKYLLHTNKEHRKELDAFTTHFIESNEVTGIIWANDLHPETYQQNHNNTQKILAGNRALIIHPVSIKNFANEISFLNSPELWNWIRKGGTLIMPAEFSSNSEVKVGDGKIKFCQFKDCKF